MSSPFLPQLYGMSGMFPPVGHLAYTTFQARNPTTSDVNWPLGTIWVNATGQTSYLLANLASSNGAVTANWLANTGGTGAIATITGDSGGAESPSAGNFSLLGTANQITVTGGTNKETFSVPSTFIAPGSIASTTTITAGTTLTATLGNITATNGNLSLATAGNKIIIATGSNASVGTSAAMSGTPGAVTVATTACSATAKVFYCRATTGGTPGNVSITAQDGTGFTLTSTGNETSTFNWWIINA